MLRFSARAVAFLLLTASSFTVPSPHARAFPAFCNPPPLHGRVAGASAVAQGWRGAAPRHAGQPQRYARLSGAARLAPLESTLEAPESGQGAPLEAEEEDDASSTIKQMHFKEETGLNDAVARCSGISLKAANYLIFLGAVFVRPPGITTNMKQLTPARETWGAQCRFPSPWICVRNQGIP